MSISSTTPNLDVQSTEVDGIPTFWLPVDEGKFSAALMFRVGRADERLATGGITHLVEHLALHPLGAQGVGYSFNGYVDPVTTVLHAYGTREDVVAFLSTICRSLQDLPLERLASEKKILHSEGHNAATGPYASLLRWRYGARTFGLPAYEQFGLEHLTAEEVAAWASERFTTGNAALWLSAAPPAELRLDLPVGPRIAAPVASSACPELPAWYAEGSGSAAMYTVVPRATTSLALRHVVEDRLRSKLRYELGASYSPNISYDPRSATDATLFAAVDVVEGHSSAVCNEVLSVLDTLAGGEFEPRTLDVWRDQMLSSLDDPGTRRGFLHVHCWDHLQGAEPLAADAWVEQVHAVQPGDVAAVAATARGAALYRLPQGQAPEDADLAAAPTASSRVFDGQAFPWRRLTPNEPLHTLTVGRATEGATLKAADGLQVSIPYAECEALLKWPDGHRVLIGADAFTLTIDPRRWVDGTSLVPLIDQAVAADRHVEMPPVPDSEREPVPALSEPWSNWFVVIACTLAVFGIAIVVAANGTALGLFFPIFFASLLYFIGKELRSIRRARGLKGFPRLSSGG